MTLLSWRINQSSASPSNQSSHTRRTDWRERTSQSRWILICAWYHVTVTLSSITCQTSAACKVCLSVWWSCSFPYGTITTSTITWLLASSSLKGMRVLWRQARSGTSRNMGRAGCPSAACAISVVHIADLIERSCPGAKSWRRKQTSWALSSKWDSSGQPLLFCWRKKHAKDYWSKVGSV